MRYTTLLIIALIPVSGFIAYFGDLLGRRMGKRRLTLWNLRPRHTAIIITTVTGMLISAVALFTLLAVDSTFRDLLSRGKEIVGQNERLIKENAGLELRNRELAKLRDKLEKLVAVRQIEVRMARRVAESAKKARDAAVVAVGHLEREISARRRELAALKRRTDVAESLLEKRTGELESLQEQLIVARSSLARAQSGLLAAETKLASAQTRLAETEKKLVGAEQQLAAQNVALEKLEKQLAEQKAALEIVESAAIKFGKQLRQGELILRQGDEIARGTVSPHQTRFGIRADIMSILDMAGVKAEKLGAKPGANGRAVRLIYRQTVSEKLAVFTEDERECVDMATDAISRSVQDALIQVVCWRNTLVGEQVPVELRLYINNLVYPKGARIAGKRLDGRVSEGRILLAVIDFLQKEVSENALKAGIIPVSNPDPRATLGKNAQEQVEELMNVVERIKSINAPVVVEVYASKDVYAADTLNMENIRFGITKSE
jgi:uncharacterized protein (DUF3084 family)